MRPRGTCLLLTAVAVCLILPTTIAARQGTATLVVTVRSEQGSPIDRAEVRAGDRRVYTDPAGEAVIVVTAGGLDVSVSAAGTRI